MKKDKFFAATIAGIVEVEGYAVKFEGYDHDFVVHRSLDNSNTWTVSHKETGFLIPPMAEAGRSTSRIKAIENAHMRMLSVTADMFNVLVGKQDVSANKPSTFIKTKNQYVIELLKLAKQTISSLKLSMLAHPDCQEGSEFDDYTSTAQEVEDKLQLYIESYELLERNKIVYGNP